MKIILAGQRSFGRAVFAAVLAAGHDVLQVFAPPPGDKGADLLAFDADAKGVPIAHKVEARAIDERAELIVCAHSHDFVSRKARSRVPLGAIGYHPSLLPRHRGRDAVEWTIRMGDAVAGGSVYWLTEKVDGGPIAASDWCHVLPRWSASDLWRERLFPMGVRLLVQTLADLERGVMVRVGQDPAAATWEPSIGRPPLHRPDLDALPPPGSVSRFRVVASQDALHEYRAASNG